MRMPSMRTSPPLGRSMPSMRRISVVLPAPLSPTRAWISPGAIERSTPWTPAPPGNSRRTPCSSILGSLIRSTMSAGVDDVERALDRGGEPGRLVLGPGEQSGDERREHRRRGDPRIVVGCPVRDQLRGNGALGVARRPPRRAPKRGGRRRDANPPSDRRLVGFGNRAPRIPDTPYGTQERGKPERLSADRRDEQGIVRVIE